MKIFWVLFLLNGSLNGPTALEGPIGIYADKSLCVKDGRALVAVVKRKAVCEPATEVALRYYAKETLGDTEWSRKIIQKEERR